MLQDKKSEDERVQDDNQPHPNQHSDPIESAWDRRSIETYSRSGGNRNLGLIKDQRFNVSVTIKSKEVYSSLEH